MKKVLIAIMALCMATAVSAQSNKTAKQKENNTSSVTTQKKEANPLGFDSLVIDYGAIKKGSSGEAVFRFTNNGKTPIILTHVEAECDCTVPEWTRKPVLPGETGEIKVSYNKTDTVGFFNKKIFVTSNKNPDKEVVLTIRGEVVN